MVGLWVVDAGFRLPPSIAEPQQIWIQVSHQSASCLTLLTWEFCVGKATVGLTEKPTQLSMKHMFS